ncbi:sulfur relay protein DsrC [Sulfuricaulis limicola]|uniref:Sulfur relay protein DsrC n=1 Tax=Sulfuricaulis limicola TaxID=1620215 RepID=A0A1B4XFK7_9GAMM|nr:sulfur relay protein DsrC [Sulfuricaulis limicola]BAV33588.1 sulfur relay protein DsrC [Sulfuricaulis limicola]
MLHLSEILLQHHDIATFEQLLEVVRSRAESEMFFRIDIKPPYPDTPANWEDQLEGAFVGIHSVTK